MESRRVKSAVNRAWEFCEKLQNDLDEGRITEEEWYRQNDELFTGAYLASENPRGQSGHSGDETAYRYTQSMILEAIHKSGSFLDVGCANGYLIEKLACWLGGTDLVLDFYGLDISEGLIALAKKRIPEWADRFFLGNALHWTPSRPFTFVCIKELEYVPRMRQRQLFEHLYDQCLAADGRLILGPYTHKIGDDTWDRQFDEWDFAPSGYCIKSHQRYGNLHRRLLWFDKNS